MKKSPENWNMIVEEVSAGVYRIVATCADGRRIEATGLDEVRLKDEVFRSIATLDLPNQEGSKQ